jgi:hypothetical protein
MLGVPKIEIAESVETLKSLMKQQKTVLNHAKVQSLYFLKINVTELASVIQNWRNVKTSRRTTSNRKTSKTRNRNDSFSSTRII